MTERPLTRSQKAVLRMLAGDGHAYASHFPGGGWHWTNHSTTVRIAEALHKRGLVFKEKHRESKGGYRYTISPAGRDAYRQLS